MLSPADSDLAKRDAALPGLATLLDPDAFADALRSAGAGEGVESVELGYLRYKPGTNCVATYRVQGAGACRLYYAKAHGRDAAAKLAKARGRSAALLLDDRGISAFAFPHDAKLGSLARLEDPARRGALLARVLRGRPGPGSDAGLLVLAYKPERRCVTRLGPGDSGSAVLKFYALEGFPAAASSSRAFESRGVLRLARRCGGSKRHRVLAFEWLEGRTLREAWADPELGMGALADVGAAVAELHAQQGAKLPPRSVATRVAELRELGATLGFLCPSLAAAALRLADRTALRLSSEGERCGAIHGDLYDKQILLDAGRVAILALDRAARGDPRSDLGLFIAHLERDAVLGRLPSARIDEVAGSLLDGYRAAGGAPVADLGAHVAEGLLHLAHHPFRSRDPDWPRCTRRILARAEEILAGTR